METVVSLMCKAWGHRLMMALAECNSWFGSFPWFYHHRVRLHNSLISSQGSSFALHSTRALKRYTFSFFKHSKSFFFNLYNSCPADVSDIWWWSTESIYSPFPLISLFYNREEFLYNSLGGDKTCFVVTGEFEMTGVFERMLIWEETWGRRWIHSKDNSSNRRSAFGWSLILDIPD